MSNGNCNNGNHHDNSNASNTAKVLWWIIGGILTPLLLAAVSTITGDSKRVTTIETVMQEVNHRLERLESKIERLIERK